MLENSFEVLLEAVDQHSGKFTLSFNTSHYYITLKLEKSITFNDLLRRLHPVLMGYSDPSGHLAPQTLLRDVGLSLWQALLPDMAPANERAALAYALRHDVKPLLLTLPDALSGLPWELLRDPEQSGDDGFLALYRPLIRFIPLPASAPPSSIGLPLRVLLLISSPSALSDNSRVDVESERAAVEAATYEARKAGLLHLLVEDIVTPDHVLKALREFRPHILHYIGHGEYDRETGGMLLWEDEQRNVLGVSGASLAKILRPRQLQAVVLHACETARQDAHTDVLSVAGTLVKAGIPAVLAQQANFSYESSQRASKVWYHALTTGHSFAEALFEVRQALFYADRPDWAVPVLQGSIASIVPLLSSSAQPGEPDPRLTSKGAATDLPAPTGVFVGRHREMRELRLMLENVPGHGPVLALITGPGGIGKSTLVAQAITRYGARYKTALTLSCSGYEGVELFLQRIADFLKRQGAAELLENILPDPKLSDAAKIEEAITALNQAGSFLLVIDNLECVQNEDQTLSDEDLLLLLRKLLTNLRSGRVLIIGRNEVKGLLPDGRFEANLLCLSLDDLSTYEANQLLLRHPTLARLSEYTRETLIREFGGLPYVYDLLSSKAASQNLDQLIRDAQGRITMERKQRSAEEWQHIRLQVVESVALTATVARLPERVQTLLGRLSVFRIPFPLDAMEQGLHAVRDEWQPLLDWSLLRYDPLACTYHLHSLAQHFAGGILAEQDRQQTQGQLAAWYEHYANNNHTLIDYLEAYRLSRAAGNLQHAGELAIQLSIPLLSSRPYSLLKRLLMTTINDLHMSDELTTANAQCHLGMIAQRQGDYDGAQQLYQESWNIVERLGSRMGKVSLLGQLGAIALERGKYEEAWQFYQDGLILCEGLKNPRWKAIILSNLGLLAQLQGDFDRAQQLYQDGRIIMEQLDDPPGKVIFLYKLGMIAQIQEDFDKAQQLYQESLDISERLGDRENKANSLHQLGMIAESQGDADKAQQFYQQSLTLSEELGSQRQKAATLNQLSTIALYQGEYDEALWFFQESLDIAERLGDLLGRAVSLYNLGRAAESQGDADKAQQFYQQSLALSEELGDQQRKTMMLYNLGRLSYGKQDYEGALKHLVQAFLLSTEVPYGHFRYCSQHLLHVIADIRTHMDEATFMRCWRTTAGDHPLPDLPPVDAQARWFFQESLKLGGQSHALFGRVISLYNLGGAAESQGDADKAQQFYQESLALGEELGDKQGKVDILYSLSRLSHEKQDYEDALKHLVQAFLLSAEVPSDHFRYSSQHLLAVITEIRTHMDEATFMRCWRTTAGDHPLPDLPPVDAREQLMKTFTNFILAQTWEEKQSFLQSHPELLALQTDDVLKKPDMQQEYDEAHEVIEDNLLLLARCREVGIDTAFAERVAQQKAWDVFIAELNRLCSEVVSALRVQDVERQKILAEQLEQRINSELPMKGARDFLQILIVWLCGGNAQLLLNQVEKLPQQLSNAYKQMVTAVEQKETTGTAGIGLSTQEVEDLSRKLLENDPSSASVYLNRGNLHYQQEEWQQAIENYTQAIALDPSDASAYLYRGNIYFQQEKWQLAIEDYTQAITLDPANASVYFYRGNIYGRQEQWQQAIEDFTQAITLDPSFALAYLNRGSVYYFQVKWQLAIEDFTQVIRLDPANTSAYFNRGVIYEQQKQWQLAIEDYTQSIELDPSLALAYFNRGNIYFQQVEWQLAIGDFTKVIELDPSNTSAYLNRGETYYFREQWQQAVEDYTKVIRLDPANVSAYLNRGAIYEQQKQWQQAIDDFTQAINLDPANVLTYIYRGNIYGHQERWQQAIEDYTQAITLDPSYASAYFQRGEIYYRQEQWQQAIEDYTQAITLDPPNTSTYLNRIILAVRKDTYFEKVVRDYPDPHRQYQLTRDLLQLCKVLRALEDIQALINLGISLSGLGHYEEGLGAVEQALSLDPNSTGAWSAKGAVLLELERDEEAIRAFERVLGTVDFAHVLNSKDVKTVFAKGFAFFGLGRDEEALEAFNHILALNPSNAEAWYAKGAVLHKLERVAEALEAFDRAFALNLSNAAAWFEKARILLELERDAEALEALDHTLALDPTHAEAWSAKGAVLRKLRHREERLETFDHTLALDPNSAYPAVPAKPLLPMKGRERNHPCPCGSGKKFKKCCGR